MWHQDISYVPQDVFISDSTFAENIAFGVHYDQINYDSLLQSASQAQILNFIESTPNKFETQLGERGTKLSGGQRQRIGLARALYKQPKVLILDEATSALDNTTEMLVNDAIMKLPNQITVIYVAHRLSTIKHCDKIFYLDKGSLIASGTYAHLLLTNPNFKRLAHEHPTISN